MNTIDDGVGVISTRHSGLHGDALERAVEARFHFLSPVTQNFAFVTIAAFELVGIVTVNYLLAVSYRLSVDPTASAHYGALAVLTGIVEICVAASLGHFANIARRSGFRFAWSGIASVIVTFAFIIALLFIIKLSDSYSRGVLVLQLVTSGFAVLAFRLIAHRGFELARSHGLVRGQRVAIVGAAETVAAYAGQLRQAGSDVQIAICDFPVERQSIRSDGALAVTTTVDRCRAMRPDSVIVLLDQRSGAALVNSLLVQLREIPADIYALPMPETKFWTTSRPAEIGGVAAFELSSRPLSYFDCTVKRVFDIVAATAGLVLLSPLLVLAGALVALSSPGPVLFHQLRHGFDNRPIRVLKFRTMYVTASDEFRQASTDDSRITSIGKIFRMTGIDELPQLWNILRGDMSLVGPRPHAIPHNEQFSSRIKNYSRRHTVKPGLTGWAQVNGFRGETDTLEKMQNRIEFDLHYIDNWSLLLDLQIIFLTLFSQKTYLNAR